MTSAPHVLHAVVGTAGHIDHGKSSLVKALTGTDPDRLKEEQERGLTIDLGYAEYHAANGADIGLIDVPGHERFVRNMVAGATGLDVVMLVVAADDSVMPQTREHLEIMQTLGIERGFVVLTKIDLVEPGMVDLVEEELAEFLQGTFLDGAPVVRCSSITGVGIDDVRAELERQVAALPPRDRSGVFRMPVQRSFTVKGHGTVVTGVPLGGTIKVGDEVEVMPGGVVCRVRGLHVHHRAVEEAGAGHRTAINLSDVNWKDVNRGDVVAAPGLYKPTTLVEVRFRLMKSWPRPIESQLAVRLHAGCAEVLGRLVLLDCKTLAPGQDALAQIRLDEPIVVAAGDTFLLRLASPEKTIGGGQILGDTRFRHKQTKDWVAHHLEMKEAGLDQADLYLEAVVRAEGLHPMTTERLPALVHTAQPELSDTLKRLAATGALVPVDNGRAWLHRDSVVTGAADAGDALRVLHERNHYAFGFEVHAVATEMRHPPGTAAIFLEAAVKSGAVERQATEYRLKAFKGGLSQEDRRLIGQVEDALKTGGFTAPSPAEIAIALQRPDKRIANLITALEATGRVVTIAAGVVLHRTAYDTARDKVVAHCRKEGELTSNFAKELIGGSRKYIIPLLEHFDAIGLTVRNVSSRTLKPGYERLFPGET